MPSSPPSGSGSDGGEKRRKEEAEGEREGRRREEVNEEDFRTPALPVRHGEKGVEEGSPTRGEAGERLTSSVIKGDAAMSLLGLRGQGR